MDFKADKCRLVVITTLPRAINAQEKFITAYLRDAGFLRRRLNSRIIQALGRCNRAQDDFGVYILADRRFATHFGRETNREGIPRNMIAEIDLAQDTAELDDVAISSRVKRFLEGDFSEYDATLAQYLNSVPSSPQTTSPLSAPEVVKAEVTAWSAMYESQNYELAADRFEDVWKAYREQNVIELGAFHKWNEAKATFPSKEALAAEAFYHPVDAKNSETDASGGDPETSFDEYLDGMFSIEHRDNLGNGCPMTASASEIARQGPAVAASFTRAFKEKVNRLEDSIKGRMPASQRRQVAVSALAAQIGAMAVARAVAKVDASLSKEVLQAVRETVRSRRTVKRKAKRSCTTRSTS